jgi:hypothetical protein
MDTCFLDSDIKETKITFEIDQIMDFHFETKEDQIDIAPFYNEIRFDSLNFFWLWYLFKTDYIPLAKKTVLIDYDYINDIEDSRINSFFRGNDTKVKKVSEEFNTLFILKTILPRKVIDFLIKTGLYKYMKYGTILFVITHMIKSAFWHDGRLRLFRKHYHRFLYREKLNKLGLKHL